MYLVFFSAQGALEGKNTEQIKEKLQDGYPQALINNYKVGNTMLLYISS
jgi:hypothetical protein